MDLDEVADELYETLPEEFVVVRKARQDEAKDDGDRALAKQIGALPKPSVAAWVCNLLVRAQREEIANLVELGDLLREAQESLAGDQLKALDVQRRQLVSALTRQARALAAERAHPVSAAVATQVEETLRAAMADPDAGNALLSGRLTSPMSYSGMGTTVSRPDLRLVRPPKPAPTKASAKAPAKPPAKPSAKAARGGAEDAAEHRRRERAERERAAEEKRRRELAEAREAAGRASAVAEEATAVLEEHRRQAEELTARRAHLQARVEELADRLADVEREAADAAAALRREERRRAGAEREAAEAVEVRNRALARVDQLTGGAGG